jgi:hypothetical protein
VPGPTPKDPKVRQRVNRDATAASLIESSPIAEGSLPELRQRQDAEGKEIPWRVETKEFWADLWTSPMATEYTAADVHGLHILAELVDSFWASPSTVAAAEIRLQRQCFGLTPIDRRRLQWEIKRVEKPGGKPEAPKRPERLADPRAVLKAVP